MPSTPCRPATWSDSSPTPSDASRDASPTSPFRRPSPRSGAGPPVAAPRSESAPPVGTAPPCPRRGRPMGRPASPGYWRRWRATHPAYRARERERTGARRRAGYRSPKTRRQAQVQPIVVVPHPLLAWARELAADLVHQDRRARLPTSSTPTSSARSSWRSWSGRTRWLAAPPGSMPSARGATTSRRCSRSAERWMARSRICACRSCETHDGSAATLRPWKHRECRSRPAWPMSASSSTTRPA